MSVSAAARTADHAIDVEDVTYRHHDGKPLLARIFKPKGAGPFPMMIDIHGGAWCNGDRTNDTQICEALAKSGIVVAALDFRMPPDGGYPASMQDINYAVRWLKANAKTFGGRPGKVGAVGISSGGHQAMLAAMRPEDARYKALPYENPADAGIACVVMCWPVVDPLGRYRVAKEAVAKGGKYPEQFDRVLPLHDLYWGSEAAMDEGAPSSILDRGEKVAMPPVLYVQGASDQVHPQAHFQRFVETYRKKGGSVDVALYEGEIDGFVVRNTKNPAHAADAMARMIAFLHRHLAA